MFDNEIDWVTGLECYSIRREARRQRTVPDTFTYKAEHKPKLQQDRRQGECSVRRVSLGDAAARLLSRGGE